jgi:hypothetical protein
MAAMYGCDGCAWKPARKRQPGDRRVTALAALQLPNLLPLTFKHCASGSTAPTAVQGTRCQVDRRELFPGEGQSGASDDQPPKTLFNPLKPGQSPDSDPTDLHWHYP